MGAHQIWWKLPISGAVSTAWPRGHKEAVILLAYAPYQR